jgi:hypothetical protein
VQADGARHRELGLQILQLLLLHLGTMLKF